MGHKDLHYILEKQRAKFEKRLLAYFSTNVEALFYNFCIITQIYIHHLRIYVSSV